MKQKTRNVTFLLVLGLAAAGVSFGLTAAALSAPDAKAPAVGIAHAQASPAQSAAIQSSQPQVLINADFAVKYRDLGQLKQAADLVVRGEVTGVEYFDFNTTAHTRVTFKVSECLQGSAREGDEITIVEAGGVTNMAVINGDKFGEPTVKDQETKVEVVLEGAPLSKVGDECLYFLGLGDIGEVKGTYYVPMGAFQGRFQIENGVAARFVPVDWAGGGYTSLSTAESALDQAVLNAKSVD